MNIAIVGVGLIGGSLALSLKELGIFERIIGVDKSKENQEKALELGLVDEFMSLDKAISASKAIVLAAPVDSIEKMILDVLNKIEDQIVVDMGSTKVRILNKIADHPKRGRYLAAHPMAGTEYSGPQAAIRGLFADKVMVYVEAFKTDEDAFELCDQIIERLHMKTVFMNALEHDMHTAYVSHISHLTSFALALTVLEKEKSHGRIFELAGSGFESTVRLAKSSSDMWTPIFKQNRENVLEVLEEHINQLKNLHDTLEKEDYTELKRLINRSNRIQRIIK
ncbi:MAG TPA: prephenate dehydrogenase [Candidatus Sphingobacterium stercoripullorum]|uniref:Prephenate dehydrogenase n=1 Tax=Candidatus Sphingobacterium stercoripullorum TaxID=2838759 RepID=A0A9D1WBD1_9SPHI|nr:prephenate dehydrogenase [Candidatus Sphingobacterium stercoripullorum]HLR49825.1 prephenate dehydrogenase [Candidatus Sphingobacterium stercoripullorum]